VGFTPIDVPGATFTRAHGINSRGDIVGMYSTGPTFHGFVLSNGTFTTLDVVGAISTSAQAIGPDGRVVGYYVAGGLTHGFVAQR
jgi:uncharacterized membrane protein